MCAEGPLVHCCSKDCLCGCGGATESLLIPNAISVEADNLYLSLGAQDMDSAGCQPKSSLISLAAAGSGGAHSSNIERDILRKNPLGET